VQFGEQHEERREEEREKVEEKSRKICVYGGCNHKSNERLERKVVRDGGEKRLNCQSDLGEKERRNIIQYSKRCEGLFWGENEGLLDPQNRAQHMRREMRAKKKEDGVRDRGGKGIKAKPEWVLLQSAEGEGSWKRKRPIIRLA